MNFRSFLWVFVEIYMKKVAEEFIGIPKKVAEEFIGIPIKKLQRNIQTKKVKQAYSNASFMCIIKFLSFFSSIKRMDEL